MGVGRSIGLTRQRIVEFNWFAVRMDNEGYYIKVVFYKTAATPKTYVYMLAVGSYDSRNNCRVSSQSSPLRFPGTNHRRRDHVERFRNCRILSWHQDETLPATDLWYYPLQVSHLIN